MRRPSAWARFRLFLLAGVAIAVVIGAAAWWLKGILDKPLEPTRKVVQEVRIVRPPPPPEEPPPPPPPPEEVDVPEPEDLPQPAEQSNEPPPDGPLGIDAEGSGAGDGFGLVGRPGGRDLLASGGGAFAWYGGVVRDEIRNQLEEDPDVRSGGYTVAVRLWIGKDGQVQRSTLVGSTGDKQRDQAIERALTQLSRLSRPPPEGMPQPLTLRIVSRA
jgi:protein TonB